MWKSRTVEALADDLAMDLALGRHVDDDVAAEVGRARRRRPAVQALVARDTSASTGPNGERWSADDSIPCFANEPTLCSTWQRPQIPRPPQTESMSTPRARAASSTVVPAGNRPRRPDGVKMTSGSASAVIVAGQPGARAAARAGSSAGRRPRLPPARRGMRGSSGRILVVAQQDVGGHDRVRTPSAIGFVIADVRPLAIAIARNGAVDPLAVRQAEADVARAAGRVDVELVAQPAEDPEDLAAGRRHGPDRHQQRVDDDVLARDAVVRGPLDDPLRDREPDVRVLGDAGLVVGDRDDGGAVLLHQRQDPLEALVLAGHRVDSALPW